MIGLLIMDGHINFMEVVIILVIGEIMVDEAGIISDVEVEVVETMVVVVTEVVDTEVEAAEITDLVEVEVDDQVVMVEADDNLDHNRNQ